MPKNSSMFKKIIGFLLISSAGFSINTSASYAANISFTPSGNQLDLDPILDIEVLPGQIVDFDINIDTKNIITNPPLLSSVLVEFSIDLDIDELQLVKLPKGTIKTPTGFESQLGFFQPIPQNFQGLLTSFQVKTRRNIVNDGLPDVTLDLIGAFIGGVPPILGAQDVTPSFTIGGQGGAGKIVSVQCKLQNFQDNRTCPICGTCKVPEPTSTLSLLTLGILGTAFTLKQNKYVKRLKK